MERTYTMINSIKIYKYWTQILKNVKNPHFTSYSCQHWSDMIILMHKSRILILHTWTNLRLGMNMKIQVWDLFLTLPALLLPLKKTVRSPKKED